MRSCIFLMIPAEEEYCPIYQYTLGSIQVDRLLGFVVSRWLFFSSRILIWSNSGGECRINAIFLVLYRYLQPSYLCFAVFGFLELPLRCLNILIWTLSSMIIFHSHENIHCIQFTLNGLRAFSWYSIFSLFSFISAQFTLRWYSLLLNP